MRGIFLAVLFVGLSVQGGIGLALAESTCISSDSAKCFSINAIQIFDEGNLGGTPSRAIDLVQSQCGASDPKSPERFFETTLSLSITNRLAWDLNFQRISFRIANADGAGRTVYSKAFSFLGGGYVSQQSVTTLDAHFMTVQDGRKYFVGMTSPAPTELGVRNIRVTLRGRDGRGQAFVKVQRFATVLRAVDRCS